MMRSPFRLILFVILLSVLTVSAALAQSAQKQGTGVITGRVLLKDKGMANVAVILYPSDPVLNRTAVARATTDFEGHYKLMGVPAGRYNVMPLAPALIGTSDGGVFREQGKSVTLAEGETVEKIDFSLVKGGVITGRVTDADGAPVIAERISLSLAENRQGSISYSSFNPYMYETDDRGVYRIYGIAAGRYTVSVGVTPGTGVVRFGAGSRGYYTRTFYQGTTDESQATVIEVTEGSEASNIDITLGRRAQTFIATGRVVDESGQPVPNIRIAASALMTGVNRIGGFGVGASTSDEHGRFRLDGLPPGRYAAFPFNDGQSDNTNYSDPTVFEITDADVSGLELKLHRGSSISGTVVIEGVTDQSVLAKLSQLSLAAFPVQGTEGLAVPSFSRTRISSDGSFQLVGVRPGKYSFSLATFPPLQGFKIARVERDGVPPRYIEVTEGAQVTGVRVVLEYGTGSVRGLVKFADGAMPEGVRMNVFARRVGDTNGSISLASQVDSRGHFLIEGLPTGDYEITLQPYVATSAPRRLPPVKQSVTVTNGIESEVTFTLDLNAKPKEGGNNE
jgi:hypothetical protein